MTTIYFATDYNFGIRLCQRSNDETIIMFNARNELDQSRFANDLGESIAEMDELDAAKTHNVIDTIHFKYLDRLRRHSWMHNNHQSSNDYLSAQNNNQANHNNINNSVGFDNDNRDQQQATKSMPSIMNQCDIRNIKSNIIKITSTSTTTPAASSALVVVAAATTTTATTTNNNVDLEKQVQSEQTSDNSSQQLWQEPVCASTPKPANWNKNDCNSDDCLVNLARRKQGSKFSSMLNLSSSPGNDFFGAGSRDNQHDGGAGGGGGDDDYSNDNSNYNRRGGGAAAVVVASRNGLSRQERLLQQQQQAQRISHLPTGERQGAISAGSGAQQHRRCSTGSALSLDSGMYLSRDVSPNQSS